LKADQKRKPHVDQLTPVMTPTLVWIYAHYVNSVVNLWILKSYGPFLVLHTVQTKFAFGHCSQHTRA